MDKIYLEISNNEDVNIADNSENSVLNLAEKADLVSSSHVKDDEINPLIGRKYNPWRQYGQAILQCCQAMLVSISLFHIVISQLFHK